MSLCGYRYKLRVDGEKVLDIENTMTPVGQTESQEEKQ